MGTSFMSDPMSNDENSGHYDAAKRLPEQPRMPSAAQLRGATPPADTMIRDRLPTADVTDPKLCHNHNANPSPR